MWEGEIKIKCVLRILSVGSISEPSPALRDFRKTGTAGPTCLRSRAPTLFSRKSYDL